MRQPRAFLEINASDQQVIDGQQQGLSEVKTDDTIQKQDQYILDGHKVSFYLSS